jgi:hypothetical protein
MARVGERGEHREGCVGLVDSLRQHFGKTDVPVHHPVAQAAGGDPVVAGGGQQAQAASAALPDTFDAAMAAQVDDETRRWLDQAAYRFMKLQDSLGEKVLPGLLAAALTRLVSGARELLSVWSAAQRFAGRHLAV